MSAKATDKSFGEEEEVLAANENNDSAVVKATVGADPTMSSEPAQNDTALLEKFYAGQSFSRGSANLGMIVVIHRIFTRFYPVCKVEFSTVWLFPSVYSSVCGSVFEIQRML